MTRKLLDDCFVPDAPLLTHDEALRLLEARVTAIAGVESVPIEQASGRIIAQSARARRPVPAHTNAAVDGYAFAFASYDALAGTAFEIGGRAAAGHAMATGLTAGKAARILTGAVVPEGADTVVMQEDVSLTETGGAPIVHVPAGLKARANVRRAGEDVQAGDELYRAGHVLRPQDLAALASIGHGAVDCYRRLRVAIVSTGDEVVRAGGDLGTGQVYDANSPMLRALVESAGAVGIDLGIWPDRADIVQGRLAVAAREYDIVVTSGGASRGEEDHMVAAIDALGTRHLWQLAIKPGRPMSFGQVGDCVVIGLPGNPVAVFVCFLMYAWPLLRRLGGGHWPKPRRLVLPAGFDFKGRKTGRREFWRGMLVQGPDGLTVDKFARDGSGLITSLRVAEGLIDIPENHGDVRKGDAVSFIPFSEFGISTG